MVFAFDIEPSSRVILHYDYRRMKGEKKERWMELAEQVAAEQDPKKFDELVKELNRLLTEKDNRLHLHKPTT
jgi:hypothetical protein